MEDYKDALIYELTTTLILHDVDGLTLAPLGSYREGSFSAKETLEHLSDRNRVIAEHASKNLSIVSQRRNISDHFRTSKG